MAFRKNHYRKISGGSLRLGNGTKIQPNEDFWAMEREIPETFKSTIVLISKGQKKDPEPEEPSSEEPEETSSEVELGAKVDADNKPKETPKETTKKAVTKPKRIVQRDS
jgi:hypothetical protein